MIQLLKAVAYLPYYSTLEVLHHIQDLIRYGGNRSFRRCEWALLKAYFFKNPYIMCKKYYRSKSFDQ